MSHVILSRKLLDIAIGRIKNVMWYAHDFTESEKRERRLLDITLGDLEDCLESTPELHGYSPTPNGENA